jgi:Cu(I)/Ag(I) efflux system periplasmic protein CusF
MKPLHRPLAAVLLLLAAQTPWAQPATADMTEGEVRKVDRETKKLTLRHGEIKSLDMPPMTMVFQVKDAAMLDKLKPGDKVRFAAEKTASGFVVTELKPAP